MIIPIFKFTKMIPINQVVTREMMQADGIFRLIPCTECGTLCMTMKSKSQILCERHMIDIKALIDDVRISHDVTSKVLD